MKTIDLSKDVNYTIYRGATEGILKMCGGSFYTDSREMAEDYARLDGEKNPCLYAFDCSNLNFLVVENNCEIDNGCSDFEKEEIEKYDGVRTSDYAQYLLFGTFDCVTGVFEKQSYDDLMVDANLSFRDYER